jgi:uncharacterized protein YajQ (UPF0234 family)
MPSFDVVSKVDVSELDNAINGIGREVKQRYDFKGTDCVIERAGDKVTIQADNEVLLRQMQELLAQYCVKRGVNHESLEYKTPEAATKGSLRQEVVVRQGIEQDISKKIVQAIKGSKLKVQLAIQGDEVRVTGKNRDDLQAAIDQMKEMKLGLPLQYINFRD